MNEEPKKLNKYYILVLVLILVIGLLTATYAFFQIDTDDSTANTTITANTDCFNITFEDISEEGVNNLDINYPIKDEYAIGKTEDTENLKPVIVKISNKCTQIQDNLNYKLAITTLAKEPENDQDKGYIPDTKVRYNVDKAMNEEAKSALSEPAYLNSLTKIEDDNIISLLKEEITKKEININDYNTVNTYIIDSNSLASNNTSTYYIKLWIDYYEGDSEAYTNPEGHEDRTYTCGDNQCKYDNSTQGQKFASVISLIADGTTSERPKTTIEILRTHDPNNILSSTIKGGMYRFQGSVTNTINNYVCFGTNSKDECTNEDTGYDKYMYRIIGITEEGQLYLIKMKGVEDESNKTFAWNSRNNIIDCAEDACEWLNADLYKRLNGIESNGMPIFINNARYEYMQEGNPWYNKIENHQWMYGDVESETVTDKFNDTDIYGANNNGLILYDIETGIKTTKTYANDMSDYIPYQWKSEKKVEAKIGLMYLHDYYLAYDDVTNFYTNSTALNWILMAQNQNTTGTPREWFISRYGSYFTGDIYGWSTAPNGGVQFNTVDYSIAVRPTFYLSSTTKIDSGSGSISDPYILS